MTFRRFAALLCLALGGLYVWRHTGGFDGWADVVGHAVPFLAALAFILPPKTLAQIVTALPFSKTAKPTDAA